MHSLVVGSSSRGPAHCNGGASVLPLAQPEVRAASALITWQTSLHAQQ